jgi:hypothetical protein
MTPAALAATWNADRTALLDLATRSRSFANGRRIDAGNNDASEPAVKIDLAGGPRAAKSSGTSMS